MQGQGCEDLVGRAALVVLIRFDGMILAISRGNDVWNLGFPGGHAEPGIDCTIDDTAFRELEEETGVLAGELSMVDTRTSGRCLVTTFVAEVVDEWPTVLRSEPFEGHVAWVPPEALVAPTCEFREHAYRVLREVGVMQ